MYENIYSTKICKILSKIFILIKILKKCQNFLILVKNFEK